MTREEKAALAKLREELRRTKRHCRAVEKERDELRDSLSRQTDRHRRILEQQNRLLDTTNEHSRQYYGWLQECHDELRKFRKEEHKRVTEDITAGPDWNGVGAG